MACNHEHWFVASSCNRDIVPAFLLLCHVRLFSILRLLLSNVPRHVKGMASRRLEPSSLRRNFCLIVVIRDRPVLAESQTGCRIRFGELRLCDSAEILDETRYEMVMLALALCDSSPSTKHVSHSPCALPTYTWTHRSRWPLSSNGSILVERGSRGKEETLLWQS